MQELPTSIGQLNALQDLYLKGCSNLQKLPTSIGQLNALQKLDFGGCFRLEEFPTSITIAYTPKPFLGEVFKVAKITYIYWPIECTPKP